MSGGIAIFERVDGTAPGDEYWQFWCPGCKCGHHIRTKGRPERPGPIWQWNGDAVKPTVTPSILVRHGNQPGDKRCHLYVEAGQLRFLSDCTHELAGKTVPMEAF